MNGPGNTVTPAWPSVMDRWGAEGIPFFFVTDFEGRSAEVIPLADIDPREIRYDLDGRTNSPRDGLRPEKFLFAADPVPYAQYKRAFDLVRREQAAGNSYLLNLTFPTSLETDLSLETIYSSSRSRHGLLYRGKFVVFSPETFVAIRDDRIETRPMKGTIDASIPGAEGILLGDEKEKAEHVTVVDLLRNDLGIVGRGVTVERFRYVERLATDRGSLLQVSSLVSASLEPGWRARIGTILSRLLPAGSVTGAPKKSTIEIIKRAEGYDRGFYTGVFGVFDGKSLESAVAIRFIERTPAGLVFKSGGGITVYSDPEKEYRELVEKIYLAF